MRARRPSPLRLYAIVRADQAQRLRTLDVAVLHWQRLAVLAGSSPEFAGAVDAALWHDGVVARALRACSAVVPFRLGVQLRSEAEVRQLLQLNARGLEEQLRRFEGRVEMGLRAIVAPEADGFSSSELLGIERVRALAPLQRRRERLSRGRSGTIFDGCYLIRRRAVETFFCALDDMRRARPEARLLGSGPWAPYSFCGVPLGLGLADARHPPTVPSQSAQPELGRTLRPLQGQSER